MEYVMGMAHGIALCAVILAAYTVGKRERRKQTPTLQPADDEAKRKAERMKNEFQQLMNYDVNTALKGKG